MRIAICDDDEVSVQLLNNLTVNFFNEHHLDMPHINCYRDGSILLKSGVVPDLVLLDIEMVHSDGITVSSELKKINPYVLIIIVTNYDRYLDSAMKVQVFRYLSKPVDPQRLYDNLKEACKIFNSCTGRICINMADKSDEYDKIDNVVINKTDIIFVESCKRNSYVHTVSGTYESSSGINYWKGVLTESCFFMSHQSYIVNFNYIRSFSDKTIYFTNTSDTAYISRRNETALSDKLAQYLETYC